MATTVIGGVTIVIATYLIGRKIYIYTRNNGSQIQQVQSQNPLNSQKLDPQCKDPDIPKWQTISMSQKQFDDLRTIAQSRYQEKVKQFTCPILMKVMRKPCKMSCCKDIKGKKDLWAEQYVLRFNIQKSGRCVLCQKEAKLDFIIPDEDMQQSILGFRYKLVKTFQCYTSTQKQKWKLFIDSDFGEGYTKEHLENFVPK